MYYKHYLEDKTKQILDLLPEEDSEIVEAYIFSVSIIPRLERESMKNEFKEKLKKEYNRGKRSQLLAELVFPICFVLLISLGFSYRMYYNNITLDAERLIEENTVENNLKLKEVTDKCLNKVFKLGSESEQ